MKNIYGLLLGLLWVFPAFAASHDPAMPQEATGDTATGQPATTEMANVATANVARSIFSTGIIDREPTENLKSVNNDVRTVYFFTELVDLEGQTIKHRWLHDNTVYAEVEFNVKGPRWRVWSSKNFQPEWTGSWVVQVINEAGETIAESELAYNKLP